MNGEDDSCSDVQKLPGVLALGHEPHVEEGVYCSVGYAHKKAVCNTMAWVLQTTRTVLIPSQGSPLIN